MHQLTLNEIEYALIDIVPQRLEDVVLRIIARVQGYPVTQVNGGLLAGVGVPAAGAVDGEVRQRANGPGEGTYLLRRPAKKPARAASVPGDMASCYTLPLSVPCTSPVVVERKTTSTATARARCRPPDWSAFSVGGVHHTREGEDDAA